MSETIIKPLNQKEAEELVADMLEEAEIFARICGFYDNDSLQHFRLSAQAGMIKFGGRFANALGHALAAADCKNAATIIRCFYDVCSHHAALYDKWLENNRNEKKPVKE